MIVLLIFTLFSGFLTVLSPCIWPILPIIFFSSSGSKRKPLGLTLGIVFSFTFFTLLLTYVIRIFSFDPNIIRNVAAGILMLLGLTFLVPMLSTKFDMLFGFLTSRLGRIKPAEDNFGSGFFTGLALGSVWAPCAGPILAAIATIAATQPLSLTLVLLVFFYSLGISLPLFGFTLAGRAFSNKVVNISKYAVYIRKVFGVIIILLAIGIYTGYDKIVQAKILDYFPSFSQTIIDFESNKAVESKLDSLLYGDSTNDTSVETSAYKSDLKRIKKAPEIVGIGTWLNSAPLTLAELKGKVVLIDFWTYTCINCIRTLPHVTGWYEKYKDKGFVVVGVHSPEFEFEKKTENVQAAIDTYKITYPVAQDNEFRTWRNYENRYWPAHYLVDANGYLRYFHFGEGKYEETEAAIVSLLEEAMQDQITYTPLEIGDTTPRSRQTPETYLGVLRVENTNFASLEAFSKGEAQYSYEPSLKQDQFAYSGKWEITNEYSQAITASKLKINFTAKKVFLVMLPSDGSNTVKVWLNGQLVDELYAGTDVKNGQVLVDRDRLYELLSLPDTRNGVLELEFVTPGTKVFAFTFGS